MFRFSKVKKKKLQEATVNKFFASCLRGWCDGIARRLVPKKTKTIWRTQVRKFHFASICNVLPCELRLFWYLTRVLNRHLANKLLTCSQQSADSRPTNGQQSANCWQKIFVKGGKRQSTESGPTVGLLSVDCWPTVSRQLADCRSTVGQQSADSFLWELFFTFSQNPAETSSGIG